MASLVLVLCQWRCLPLLYTSCSRKAQTVRFFSKEPFIFLWRGERWGGGVAGICEAPFKNRMSPSLAYQLFLHDPPFNDLFYGRPPIYLFPTSRYCAHYVGNIYNPYTTERCFLKNTNQNKEKSLSDLLVIGLPESVTFGLHWHLPHLN